MLKTEIIGPWAITVVEVTLKQHGVYVSLVVITQQKPLEDAQEIINKKPKHSSSDERKKRKNSYQTIRKRQNNIQSFLTSITLSINGLNPPINMCIETE